MSKLTTVAVTLAVALAGGAAFADESSMSRWTGESYKAFEAARTSSDEAVNLEPRNKVTATPDNGMSRWNGQSYVAFEQARTSPDKIEIAGAKNERGTANHDLPMHAAARCRSPVNPFRDDTGA